MRGHLAHACLTALALVALGCSDGRSDSGGREALPPLAPPDAPTDPLANLPATFRGDLPCIGCEKRRYHLNMYPDQTYALRVEEVGGPAGVRDSMGAWVMSSDHRTVVLKGGEEAAPEFFGLKDGFTLRRLDDDAREIDVTQPWDLRRAGRFQPFDVALDLRGSYVIANQVGTFTDCASGRRWPVAVEAAGVDLDRAYAGARLSPGEAVIVGVRARITPRARAAGLPARPTLVVDKVVRVFPGQTCSQRFASAPLEGTEWRLVRVGAQAVPSEAMAATQPPSIVLEPTTLQFSGSGGCNRLAGDYQRNGGRIQFSQSVQTRLACPAGMEIDRAFADALQSVRRWRVLGRILELQDDAGRSLARFEAGG